MADSARQTEAITALGEEMIALAKVLDQRLQAVEDQLQTVSGRLNGEPLAALSERLREVESRLAALSVHPAAEPAQSAEGVMDGPPALDLFEAPLPELEAEDLESRDLGRAPPAPDLTLVDTQADFIPTPLAQPAAAPRRAARRAGERRTALIAIAAALALALAGAGFYLMRDHAVLAAADATAAQA